MNLKADLGVGRNSLTPIPEKCFFLKLFDCFPLDYIFEKYSWAKSTYCNIKTIL